LFCAETSSVERPRMNFCSGGCIAPFILPQLVFKLFAKLCFKKPVPISGEYLWIACPLSWALQTTGRRCFALFLNLFIACCLMTCHWKLSIAPCWLALWRRKGRRFVHCPVLLCSAYPLSHPMQSLNGLPLRCLVTIAVVCCFVSIAAMIVAVTCSSANDGWRSSLKPAVPRPPAVTIDQPLSRFKLKL